MPVQGLASYTICHYVGTPFPLPIPTQCTCFYFITTFFNSFPADRVALISEILCVHVCGRCAMDCVSSGFCERVEEYAFQLRITFASFPYLQYTAFPKKNSGHPLLIVGFSSTSLLCDIVCYNSCRGDGNRFPFEASVLKSTWRSRHKQQRGSH